MNTWLDSFSLRPYLPMLRLASGTDRRFLAGCGGARRLRRYRRAQRSLLREYLRGLLRDFHRLNSIAAAKERPPQWPGSMELSESRLSFIFGVLWIEARLALHAVFPHTIDVEPLFQSVEALARAARETERAAPGVYAY
jgi:hypothetical protein